MKKEEMKDFCFGHREEGNNFCERCWDRDKCQIVKNYFIKIGKYKKLKEDNKLK